jgi:hypothetical protein
MSSLIRETEGMWSLGRPRHSWEDNIKMGIHEIVCKYVNMIHLAQFRIHMQVLVDTVTKLWVP